MSTREESLSNHLRAIVDRERAAWEEELARLKERKAELEQKLQPIDARIAELEAWIQLSASHTEIIRVTQAAGRLDP